eukprot:gene24521-29633_t
MALGMPLAFSLLVSGVALMLHLDNFDTQIVSQNLINGADNFPLMAVPFFMLAGELMNAGGMSRRIVNSAMVWVGHFRGGLGYVAVFAAIVMASLSGSAVADTAALAAVLLPMMRKAGYRMDRSAGLIAAGGIIAPVIPPSIGFILFGVIGGVSISKLFMAGIFPGLMMGFALIVTWWIVARKDKVEVAEKVPFKERISVTINAFWSYLLAITIIGGMKMGVFTPTEAAVVAVVYSLFVGLFIYREIKFKDLYGIILAAAKTSSVVMFLVAAALVSAWLITVANIPAQIVEILRPFIDNKTLLMVMLMLLVMIVGTALDFAPTVLILTPVLMPLVREAGIDPVYFGVLFIMNNAIGLLTPPVGTVLNVVCGVGRIPMHDVIRGVMPFLISQVVVMGSSAGIGLALAEALAQAGAHVILNGRTASKVEAAAHTLKAQNLSVSTSVFDVTDADSVRAAVEQIEAEGPIDILINNAGMQIRGPLHEYADSDWHTIMKTNLDSVYFVGQAVAKKMIPRGRGKIINICSVQSELGRPGIAPYTATKGAVKMLTKGMAIDWGQFGINVNGIGPGYFKTELNQKLVDDPAFSSWLVGRTPSRRWGDVQDLGGAAVFLASDASRFVNGHILYVDGGVTATL